MKPCHCGVGLVFSKHASWCENGKAKTYKAGHLPNVAPLLAENERLREALTKLMKHHAACCEACAPVCDHAASFTPWCAPCHARAALAGGKGEK